MITFFTLPRPFHGNTAERQLRAIQSWKKNIPGSEILLFSDDEGIQETATALNCRYFPEVQRNEFGTPLLHTVFRQASKSASFDLLCYINTDILLLSDFKKVLPFLPGSPFLMVGQRLDINPENLPDAPEISILKNIRRYGHIDAGLGSDYFLYRRGQFTDIPPFAIGRGVWDNWLIYHAREEKIPLIDATHGVTVIHQNHDYAHVANPQKQKPLNPAWKKDYTGPERDRNISLAGKMNNLYNFTPRDASYQLTRLGLTPAIHPRYLLHYPVHSLVPNWSSPRRALARLFLLGPLFLIRFIRVCLFRFMLFFKKI